MASRITVPTARLASGSLFPVVGLGTWKIPKEDAAATVKEAIRMGYTHIGESRRAAAATACRALAPTHCCGLSCAADCASDYDNEKEVGAGLTAAFTELGVARDAVWVTSKLWNTNHRAEHVRPSCEQTLKDLGLGVWPLRVCACVCVSLVLLRRARRVNVSRHGPRVGVRFSRSVPGPVPHPLPDVDEAHA
jgi:hypothetical protein